MSRCYCGHLEHDNGVGECYESGCKCRTYTRMKVGDEVLLTVVGRIESLSEEAPMVGVAVAPLRTIYRYPSEVTPFMPEPVALSASSTPEEPE